MFTLLDWVDRHPQAYYIWGLITLFAFVALAIRSQPVARSGSRSDAALLICAFVAVFAWRWPTVLVPYPLHSDEAIPIAAALKVAVDPISGHRVDVGGRELLSAYVLAFPALWGGRINVFTARITSLILFLTTLCAIYSAVRSTCGVSIGRLSIVPGLVWLCLTTDTHIVRFSSAYLVLALTTAALAAAAYLARRARVRLPHHLAATGAGLCLGACLTDVYLVAVVAAILTILLAAILSGGRRLREGRLFLVLDVVLGVAVAPAGLVLLPWLGGLDLTSMLQHSVTSSGVDNSQRYFFVRNVLYTVFAALAVLSLAMSATAFSKAWRRHWNRLLFGSLTLLSLSSIYVTYRSPMHRLNELLLLLTPLSCSLAFVLWRIDRAGLFCSRRPLLRIIFVGLFCIPALASAIVSPNLFVGYTGFHFRHRTTEVGEAIPRHAERGDRVTIWRWSPGILCADADNFSDARRSDCEANRRSAPGPL